MNNQPQKPNRLNYGSLVLLVITPVALYFGGPNAGVVAAGLLVIACAVVVIGSRVPPALPCMPKESRTSEQQAATNQEPEL